MKDILITIVGLIAIQTALAQETVLQNVYNRAGMSLNGDWNYIVDPYENGYYNYRYEAFDKQSNISKSAFFMNAKPNGPEELLEYDFDKMKLTSWYILLGVIICFENMGIHKDKSDEIDRLRREIIELPELFGI